MEMSEKTIKMARLGTLALWIVVIINWVVGLPVASTALHWTGICLIGAHVVELAVFSGKLKYSSNKPLDALQIIVYGYFHAITLKEES